MDMGLDKILNPLRVCVFLIGLNIFYGFGFGTAKSDEFVPVAILYSTPFDTTEMDSETLVLPFAVIRILDILLEYK